jgi:hypothetical protein
MLHVPAGILPETQALAGTIVFLASYLVFALGKFPGLKIDRTGAAIIGAIAMVVFHVVSAATPSVLLTSAPSCCCSR